MNRTNLNDVELSYDEEPKGYGAGYRRISPLVGAEEINLNVVELARGQAVCPYHYEYVEEWLIVLEGEVAVRTPEGEELARRGDAVCFPTGPAGAHKVTKPRRRSRAGGPVLELPAARGGHLSGQRQDRRLPRA